MADSITTTNLGLPPKGTSINAWIDQQIEGAKYVFHHGEYEGQDVIMPAAAAEIARGAALQVIADKETLIANLRRAGYTVIGPAARPTNEESR